jgi:hypothetical protein
VIYVEQRALRAFAQQRAAVFQHPVHVLRPIYEVGRESPGVSLVSLDDLACIKGRLTIVDFQFAVASFDRFGDSLAKRIGGAHQSRAQTYTGRLVGVSRADTAFGGAQGFVGPVRLARAVERQMSLLARPDHPIPPPAWLG